MLGSSFILAIIWHSMLRRRRYIVSGGALALVLILASAVPHFVAEPDVHADAKPGNLPAHRHATFARALADAYRAFVRDDRQTYGTEFDHKRIDAKLAAIRDGQLPPPSRPKDYGLHDAVAVALSEARTRLTRAMGGTARDAAPVFAAKAQVSYDCWAARAGARLPDRDVAICRARFARNLTDLENAVLPIRTTSPFNRVLAREYLAYAAFKASVRKDYIDASHFARKGLLAARSNDPKAVTPEILSRWNLDSEKAVPRFVRWREQLVAALARHRTSSKAAVAAKAQARFDCWVERESERAPAPFIRKCESEFIGYIRQLKGLPPRRKKMQLVVLFQDRRARISEPQYAQIKRAATLAKRSGARTITVIARTPRPDSGEYEVRLALRRAAAVAKALRHQGVRGDRIRTLYLSEAPRAKGKAAGPRITSQRAEIVIH
jgi:OOP family OmpA-OmpF porin